MTDQYNTAEATRTATDGKMISADRVQGTAVYDHAGDRLGTVDTLMIDKRSGQVAYAVMSFGGFLGIGERYHQLPWSALTYDTEQGGYRVSLTKEALKDAPNYSRDDIDRYDYDRHGEEIDNWYAGSGRSGLI